MNLKAKDIDKLRATIALHGYSINSFAKKINVSSKQLGEVLRGTHNPYPPFAKKIANGLGVSIKDIFFTDYVHK